MEALDLDVVKKKQGKRYAGALGKIRAAIPNVETSVNYKKAFEVIIDTPRVKFDETVHVAIRLGVDPKQADQMVRGAITLPHGLGKASTKIAVFAKGDKAKEAEAAGADHVGAEDLIEKVLGGFQDFEAVVATPDMMGLVSKLGRVLGPRGLMPNPKVGTVTFDVGKTVQELKKGRVEFRVEKAGVVHAPVGKVSFGAEKLSENFVALMEQVVRLKPQSTKGNYILSLFAAGAMGPSIRVDFQEFLPQ